MGRTHLVTLSIVMLLGTLLIGGGTLAAQDSAPADYAGHPLVGSWVLDTQPENPQEPLELATVSSDGTTLTSTVAGLTGHGVWEPTGDSTAAMTIHFIYEDGSRLMIRGDVEVAPDGQSFTSPHTLEFFDPAGQGTGEIGPGTAEATRIEPDTPGTPVASFEEFFGPPSGTPAG